jgi:hypothetical protein
MNRPPAGGLAPARPRCYRCHHAAGDDSALRTAAQQLLRAARRSMPGVDWAAQVVESDHGFFVVEVAVDNSGPLTTTILLDLGGSEQKILAQLNGREG